MQFGESLLKTSVVIDRAFAFIELPPALSAYVTRHPQVFASCVEVDPAMAEEDAALVWDIAPDGTLEASIVASGVAVASGK